MLRQRDLALLFALMAAATTTAWGQTTPSVVEPGHSASQTTVSIPDVSGTWVYPYCCGFEPPVSGPAPVLKVSPQPNARCSATCPGSLAMTAVRS
jgi:hypothetical protein